MFAHWIWETNGGFNPKLVSNKYNKTHFRLDSSISHEDEVAYTSMENWEENMPSTLAITKSDDLRYGKRPEMIKEKFHKKNCLLIHYVGTTAQCVGLRH